MLSIRSCFGVPPCTGPEPWIPLLAASVNPEETPFFRKELTEETHKSEGERVRGGGGKEWKKGWGGERGQEVLGHNPGNVVDP